MAELCFAADEARHRRWDVVPLVRRSDGWNLVAQDRLLELLELLAGLETELLVEECSGAPIGGERIGLPLCSVEGEHQVMPQPFAVRVLAEEAFELIDQAAILAEAEIRLDPIFDRGHAKVLQALRLRPQRAIVAVASKRIASPELKGATQPRGGATGRSAFERLMALSHEALETSHIHVVGLDFERVTHGATRDSGTRAQHRPELRDVGAHRCRRAVGWLALPELVGQAVDCDRSRRIDQQERQQDALARPSERDRASVPDHLDRPEHPELDHARSGPRFAAVFMERW